MVEIKSKNYSTPLNLSSAVGHAKDLSFARGWPTHSRDALIQSAAQIRSAHRWVTWADASKAFSVFCLAICCLTTNTGGELSESQPLCRDEATVKANVPISGADAAPWKLCLHHLLDGNLGCQASLCSPFSSKWLTHRDGNMTLTLWWDHCFFLITDTWRNVKWAQQSGGVAKEPVRCFLGQPSSSLWWVCDESPGHGSLLSSSTSLLRILQHWPR